jgi:hypothetical protein
MVMNFTDNVTLDFFKLNQRLREILDFGFRIADLLYRFALSFFIKSIRRRRTLNPKIQIQKSKSKNPNSKIQNPKFMKITVRSLFKSNHTKESLI